MQIFDLTFLVLSLLDFVRKHPSNAFNRLMLPRTHLRWVKLALGCDLLDGLVTAQRLKRQRSLELSEKLRRFVILVSIHFSWIHLSILSEFAGLLQILHGWVN